MLTFRNTIIAAVIVLLILISYSVFINFSVIYFVIYILIFSGILAYGSAIIGCNFYTKSFCKAKTKLKVVSITFDDGPSENTNSILDILKKHNTRASFFVVGEFAESSPEIIARAAAEGHLIGNHTYSHSNYSGVLSTHKMVEEIELTNQIIQNITNKTPKYFRPPFGVTNPNIASAIKITGMESVGWSVRSLDTTIKDSQLIIKRVLRQIHPGAVILLHDTTPNILFILDKLILNLKEKGYKIERLDVLMALNLNIK